MRDEGGARGKAEGAERWRLALSAFLLALSLASCATPTRPTGGPDDTTPPRLVGSVPEAGGLRVAEREVTLTFSERVNPQGVRAVSVVPESGTPPEVEVRGRELRITLDSLRESTTYVVTVSTDLRDQRGVALREPITLAFSTGDELDRGRIAGRVLTPSRGQPAAGLAVWAYRADSTAALPDPRRQPPDYGTQAGADGAFALEYLREGTYFVVAVDDRNRNRRADAGERFAAPPRPLARADTLESDPLALYVAVADTLAPEVQRLRGLTDRRLAVRFSEAVTLQDADPAAWALADSTSGASAAVRAVYVDPESPQEVRMESAEPLAAQTLRVALVRVGAVADSAGNAVEPFERTVTPAVRPDTVAAQFAAFLPASSLPADSAQTLRPDKRPGVRFTLPPDSARIASLSVTASGAPVAFTTEPLADGLSMAIRVAPEVRAFAVGVVEPDTVRVRRYRRPEPNETGEIVGRVTGTAQSVLVEAVPEAGAPFRAVTDAEGRFRIAGLPPGDYRLRFVVDTDGDGAWSSGRLAPYAPPETVTFADAPQTVRARFETDTGEIALEN